MSGKVIEWLQGLGLDQYAGTFEDNAVEFDILTELTDADLKEMGIGALGHRKKLLKAISALQPQQPAALSPADKTVTNESSPHPLTEENSSAWSRTPGERKPVTMLFADIVGSTALTEKLDAEDAHDLLYRATQHMCQAVENNRGTVCRFMGDGIMAMFGAPISSERHALEACRAALEMQSRIRQYTAEIETSHATGVQLRVGLNSGEVVVLEVGDDPNSPEYDASGPTVPLAARMEQSAVAGTIQMTRETRVLAGDQIDTTELPAMMLKGVSEPVTVHRLNGLLSAIESSKTTPRRPIVGRKSELAQFRGLLETCVDSGHGQTVLVRGEAGIGKTRLVEEMTRLARENGFVDHKALVLDFGAGKGQEAIPSLVRSLLGVAQGSGKRSRETALNQAEADGIVNHENRVFLNDLLDLIQPSELRTVYDAMDQQGRKEGKRTSVAEILTRLAAHKSIFVVIEDLHWADSITLDYLARFARVVAECPALMVFTSRAEGDPIDTTWRARAGEAPIVTWDLSPLRKEESVKMVSAFIDASDNLARRCIERAAGNPLFLEQLLLSIEKGAGDSVPDSIKSLVLSRMDQLSKQDKQALQAASVLGQRFELDALRHLAAQPAYECRELIERHLVRPEGSLYLFAHALIQEGAYASLLKGQRCGLHRQAAAWYAERDAVLYAEHLDQAGDAGAATAYLAAANEQSGLNRSEGALQLARRGLEIASATERFALCCLEGELLRNIGSVSESVEVYRLASNIAGDDIELCRALLGVAQGLALMEVHQELIDVLEDAEVLAQASSLTMELAHIYQLRGGALFFGSDTAACFEANRISLQYAREAKTPELEAQALSGLGDVEYSRGHYKSASRYFTQCIELARQHGYGRVIASNLPMLAELHYWELDFESAEQGAREAVELAQKTGNLRAELMGLSVRSSIHSKTGDPDTGMKWMKRSLDICRLLGSKNMQGMCLSITAGIAFDQVDRSAAVRFAQQAVEVLREADSGMVFYGPSSLGVLALATEDIELRRSAMDEAEALLADFSTSHNYLGFYEMAMEVCIQMAAWDEADRYAEALEKYMSNEPMPHSHFLIARGRALTSHGRGNRDQATMHELQRLYDEVGKLGLQASMPALEAALTLK